MNLIKLFRPSHLCDCLEQGEHYWWDYRNRRL